MYETVGRQNLTLAYGGGGSKYGPAYKGGIWYSTPHAGECKDGHRVGDGSGCTWRLVDRQKIVNASCMYGSIDAAVVEQAPSCFSACPQPKNVTSSCYLKCYTETTAAMSDEQLTAPWTASFAGGCPEFKP